MEFTEDYRVPADSDHEAAAAPADSDATVPAAEDELHLFAPIAVDWAPRAQGDLRRRSSAMQPA
eukprot:8149044-Pyramimonas_sp.AAC.1